jgi:predicted dehydrogenase
MLILAVPDRLNESVPSELLDLKIPVLAETPLAWTIAGTKRLIERPRARGCPWAWPNDSRAISLEL